MKPEELDTPQKVDGAIARLADRTTGLAYWYIGNIERWGDDRRIMVTALGTSRPNCIELFDMPAQELTARHYWEFSKTVKAFNAGWFACQKHVAEQKEQIGKAMEKDAERIGFQ